MTRIGILLLATLPVACGSVSTGPSDDGGTDAPADAPVDLPPDVPADLPRDTPADVPADVPADAPVEVPGDVPADAPVEVPADVPADAPDAPDGAECPTWRLTEVAPAEVVVADPVPATVGRTLRIRLSHMLDCQQRFAMPEVIVREEARHVAIWPRIWDTRRDCAAPARRVDRWIPLTFASAGTWTIESPPGTTVLTVEVGAEPASPCDLAGGACDEDCDCPPGEVCLGGSGLGGAFTACAVPCELDLDCPHGGSCLDVEDGLDRTCDGSIPQCGEERACPTGFACDGGACRPDYRLGSSARIPCECASDCAPPLICAEPAEAGGTRRCEYGCPTDGAWCPGAHACGSAADDRSGLASTDSVCGWIGD